MIEDIKELGENIKSLIVKQDESDKKANEISRITAENTEALRQMNAKAGRMIPKSSPAAQSTLEMSISNEIADQADGFAKLARKEIKELNFSLKAAPQDMTFPNVSPSANTTITQIYPGIIQIPPRPVHLREVFPQQALSTAYLAFLKETTVDGGISAVKEGSTKPQLSVNLSETQVKAQVIAGWATVSIQMLEDIPQLQSFLSYRLNENLLVQEDFQILSGNGFDPNLPGLLLAANHTVKTGSATIFVEQLVQAVGQLASIGRRASAIIVNPTDFYAMMILKGTTNDYTNPVVIQVTQGGGITLLGIPIIWSAAITATNYLVGDFTHGAALYYRSQPIIQAFYQDGNNVQNNMVTVRIEERVCMPVYSSAAFIYPS